MQQPLFVPEATWRPPNILPELDTVISIDLETCDPNLKLAGPGYKRNDGKVIGIAIADKHHTLYLPFDHLGGDNLDKRIIVSYVKNAMSDIYNSIQDGIVARDAEREKMEAQIKECKEYLLEHL